MSAPEQFRKPDSNRGAGVTLRLARGALRSAQRAVGPGAREQGWTWPLEMATVDHLLKG